MACTPRHARAVMITFFFEVILKLTLAANPLYDPTKPPVLNPRREAVLDFCLTVQVVDRSDRYRFFPAKLTRDESYLKDVRTLINRLLESYDAPRIEYADVFPPRAILERSVTQQCSYAAHLD